MNSSFGRGFKKEFYRTNFFKSSTNFKNIFNMFNTKINSPFFKMQLSNKYFSNCAVFLKNHQNLSIVGSKSLTGESRNSDKELFTDFNDNERFIDEITLNQSLIMSVMQSIIKLK